MSKCWILIIEHQMACKTGAAAQAPPCGRAHVAVRVWGRNQDVVAVAAVGQLKFTA